MINLISQGKIIRQFWDKIIRHSTVVKNEKNRASKQTFVSGGALTVFSKEKDDFMLIKIGCRDPIFLF